MGPLLFDAVLFDLDGTLVATDRFWLQAARTGTRRALRTLGVELEMPDREAWLGVIGRDIKVAFRELFPTLDATQVAHVLAACEEEEHLLIEGGSAALMPGARELLLELRRRGVRVGIASNCSSLYLLQMLDRLDLRDLVEEAYCLETPGIENKAAMIERLLQVFDTQSAVMVGDRLGDRDAAWSNGIPHVHCRFGFAGSESVEAEGVIDDLGELLPRLFGRNRWIEGCLARIGLLVEVEGGHGLPPDGSASVVGVTGTAHSGKTLWARDAARVLREKGRPAESVSLEAFRQAQAPAGSDLWENHYDLDRLDLKLSEPKARAAPAASTVFLSGSHLLEPRIHSRLDRLIHLSISDALRLRRELARRLSGGGTPGESEVGELPLALQDQARRHDPARLADLCEDASNPLGES